MRTTTCTTEYELRCCLGNALNDLRTAVERCNTVGTPGVPGAGADDLLAAVTHALEEARQAAGALAAFEVLTLEAEWLLAYAEPTFDTIERTLRHLKERVPE